MNKNICSRCKGDMDIIAKNLDVEDLLFMAKIGVKPCTCCKSHPEAQESKSGNAFLRAEKEYHG